MTWDALWWLILGSLLGWVALWFCDKLFLRDGDVAGIRAERELASSTNELDLARDQVRREVEKAAVLQSDLTAINDQADVLRTELALIGNERNNAQKELQAEKDRSATLQREIESSRKLAADRADEINRMKQSFIALENERDVAQRWAQGKETETAQLSEQSQQHSKELIEARRLLGQASHQIQAAQRTARLLEAQIGSNTRLTPRLHQKLRGRMKYLASIQRTVDVLTAADDARRASGNADAGQDKA